MVENRGKLVAAWEAGCVTARAGSVCGRPEGVTTWGRQSGDMRPEKTRRLGCGGCSATLARAFATALRACSQVSRAFRVVNGCPLVFMSPCCVALAHTVTQLMRVPALAMISS